MKSIKMKICGIICEYNPFHNGHLYQINAARTQSGADAVVCIMSGNFVQRGEAAILHKYVRAKHAVQAGADLVLELPSPFATANAELFAKGAVHILSSIPNLSTLSFGAETADKQAFINAAKLLNNEPTNVSKSIQAMVSQGMSYAKARFEAWKGELPQNLLNSPNNILGLEYTKAILTKGANLDILPITRIGEYKDGRLDGEFASATAIREHLKEKTALRAFVPEYVYADLPSDSKNGLENLEKYALLSKTNKKIAQICDCNEGLENALKRVAQTNEPLVETLTSARYTSSRIRRIALQNLLNIDEKLIRDCLYAPLYLRVLAAKKERTDLLSALSESPFPLIIRAHDENGLSGAAKACFDADLFADLVYGLLYPSAKTNKNPFI
ncbi:MAG: nucleotidyltransferase family protein [Clostridiales bacterium]|nr:nucleotidyltransferase family protein [Clostridiales bacterium]